jgi:hypothetical protein
MRAVLALAAFAYISSASADDTSCYTIGNQTHCYSYDPLPMPDFRQPAPAPAYRAPRPAGTVNDAPKIEI